MIERDARFYRDQENARVRVLSCGTAHYALPAKVYVRVPVVDAGGDVDHYVRAEVAAPVALNDEWALYEYPGTARPALIRPSRDFRTGELFTVEVEA